ncbi:ankyrin repeat protein [Anaeramoeba flamelloides]|uniref:Ankyrin repeat domain-containing protein 54 n=1 Tax=Anaeramoeba flamelloides TaxID=1746091 RepID=A0ABQ8ZCS3_9EUKA|nr:ankyrin repeat protein [Anaeramoeba flamelloides]
MDFIKQEYDQDQKEAQGQEQDLSYGPVKEKETDFIYNDESKLTDDQENNRLHLYLLKSQELDLKIIKKMIEENNLKNLDLNRKLQTYLHCLCSNSLVTIELIEFFIDLGLDLNALDENKKNCLHILCTYKNISIKLITYLVNNGISINQLDSNKNSLLHLMCKNHPQMINLELFQFLKKNNFKFNAKNSSNETALHSLCGALNNKYLNPKLIQLFIDFGMDINQLVRKKNSILHLICKYQRENINLELFQFLKDYNFNFNIKNSKNQTALHLFCSVPKNNYLKPKFIQLFIDFGMDINELDGDQRTILHSIFENNTK